MIKDFLLWYKKSFLKKPLIALVVTIVVFITGFGGFLGGLNEIYTIGNSVYAYFFVEKYSNHYKLVELLNTDVSANYLCNKLGAPILEQELFMDSYGNQYFEMAFSDDAYFIHLILDSKKIVKAYTVIARKKDFTPRIPLPSNQDFLLGKAYLSKLSESPDYILIDFSSKFWYYTELNYFGNPGYYRYYLFGDTPLGVSYEENISSQIPFFPGDYDECFDILEVNYANNESVLSGRHSHIPNAFCVISDQADEELIEYIQSGYLGFDYYIARTIE